MTTANSVAGQAPGIGRRELITGAGVAALAALFAGPARGSLDLLPFVGGEAAPFERPEIVSHLGDTFTVVAGASAGAVLRLAEVVELAGESIADTQRQFAVRFTGPAGLAQNTYEFSTRSFGRMPLFVSPVSESGAMPAVYEAIVNRYVPGTADHGGAGS